LSAAFEALMGKNSIWFHFSPCTLWRRHIAGYLLVMAVSMLSALTK